jgi:paraquat-inducible protein A
MLNVEQFGHRNEASILQGVVTLISGGHLVVGVVVLLCSIVLPLGKLVSLLVLSGGGWFMRHEQKAITYHIVEWTGRWGMLDILLVAILVAVLKIGDWVEVTAGPAAFAFTACVVLSLLATASFDPRRLWRVSPVSDC